MTTKVKAETEVLIFKATVASFYDFSPGFGATLVAEFEKWMKEKGKLEDFLVFDASFTREKFE